MNKPLLEEAIFHFSQEGSCIRDTDDSEFLEIKCVSDLGIDRDEGNCFYELKTERWSIDGVDDLQELFNRIEKSLKQKQ